MKNFEIENIKQGNVDLFEQLFKYYYEHLVLFAFRYVKNRQAAEDVVHDVFINIWNNRKKLDFSLNFKSYLYSSVRNQSLKYIKNSNKVEKTTLDVVFIPSEDMPDNIIIKDEFEKAIADAISNLPDRRQEIFCMHRFDNLSYSEIAMALEISVKTVENQMGSALKFLRKKLSYLLK
jgi:RNA polymerase sigma-70 factor (ECF subfamily)